VPDDRVSLTETKRVKVDIDIFIPFDPDKNGWKGKARCKGLPPTMFFPERGQMVPPSVRKMCAACEVREECLEFAVLSNEQYGIWAGTSIKQRRRLRLKYIIDNNLHLTPTEVPNEPEVPTPSSLPL